MALEKFSRAGGTAGQGASLERDPPRGPSHLRPTAGQNEQAVYDFILMRAVNVFAVPGEYSVVLGAVFYLPLIESAYRFPSFDPK
jgi:hypothetical protein